MMLFCAAALVAAFVVTCLSFAVAVAIVFCRSGFLGFFWGVFKSYLTLLSYQASGLGWERALSSVRSGINALLLRCSLHCIYTCIGLLSGCSPGRRCYRQTRRVSQLSAAFSASERTLSSVSWDMDAHALQQSLSSLVPSETENVHFLM